MAYVMSSTESSPQRDSSSCRRRRLNGSLPTSKALGLCPTFTYAKPPENWSANHVLYYNEGIIPQCTAPATLGTTPEAQVRQG